MARNKNEKGKGGYWELAMDISKSDRKRRRRKIRSNPKLDGSVIRLRRDPPIECEPQQVEIEEVPQTVPASPQPGYSAEEVLNSIEENIRESIHQDDKTVESTLPMGEIFFADQIPQCTNHDIIVPFLSNTDSPSTTPNRNNELNSQASQAVGPNVIVEPVPCYLPTMDTFDENELNGLIDLNEQELIDRLLDGGDDHGIFVN